MADLGDFGLLVGSEPVQGAWKTPEPATPLPHSHSTFEGLLYPIVIINRQGNICFMNGTAQRVLAEGLDLRLATHVRHHPDMGPITQVHFKLQNGRDLILKVRLGQIEWLGENAIQVSIWNVTPYLAMIQDLQKEMERQKQALEEIAACRPELEQQLAAYSETLARLQAEFADESAARAKAQEEIRGLRENLDVVTQENTRLQSDLARVTREHEESKESLAAELEQTRSELRREASKSAEAFRTWEPERAASEGHARELESGRVTEKLAVQVETPQSELSAAGAEREELRPETADQLAGDSSVCAEMKAEIAEGESLEKEIAPAQEALAVTEQAQSEGAETCEELKGEAPGHTDAQAPAAEAVAEAARSRLVEAMTRISASASSRPPTRLMSFSWRQRVPATDA